MAPPRLIPSANVEAASCRLSHCFLVALAAVFTASAAGAETTLPPTDGSVLVAAQEWPRYPGPREIRVYITYPGGKLANVGPATGLFLSLHNWGGTAHRGAPDPEQLASRCDCVAIGVDYLQSGQQWKKRPPYDFGYLQALDALRALWFVYDGLDSAGIQFHRGRIYATGGSGGGNVALMANKLAPRTFACIVDLCGMAKLADDIAFGIPGRTGLNAAYSPDPEHPCYLNRDAQAIRFVGCPVHARQMKRLGNTARIIVVHGVDDASCPVEDAREMVANMQDAGLSAESVWVTQDMLDGKAFKSTGHSLGDRTRIVFKVAGTYLLPGAPDAAVRAGKTDFDLRDEQVRYKTPGGVYIMSYAEGCPTGRFKRE